MGFNTLQLSLLKHKFSHLWLVVVSSNWLQIPCDVKFIVFLNFLHKKQISFLGSYLIFPAPILESVVSPKTPCDKWYYKMRVRCWVLIVSSFLVDAVGKIRVCVCFSNGIIIYVYVYIIWADFILIIPIKFKNTHLLKFLCYIYIFFLPH